VSTVIETVTELIASDVLVCCLLPSSLTDRQSMLTDMLTLSWSICR